MDGNRAADLGMVHSARAVLSERLRVGVCSQEEITSGRHFGEQTLGGLIVLRRSNNGSLRSIARSGFDVCRARSNEDGVARARFSRFVDALGCALLEEGARR
ncbi:hypothetical protein [Bradyrhizobium sp.]|uniref:hypothetical protein n=1 Tax=Bradyrhizobium sp. TaxID=376 RepID=UPI0025C32893|nr:hypothetical protein [Bradyrhizobium sp.]